MKFINAPISVEARKGVPRRIRWGRRIYTVRRLLDFWIFQTRWWARDEKRVYFRVETDQGVMEVYREEEERAARSGPAHGVEGSEGEDRGLREDRRLREDVTGHRAPTSDPGASTAGPGASPAGPGASPSGQRVSPSGQRVSPSGQRVSPSGRGAPATGRRDPGIRSESGLRQTDGKKSSGHPPFIEGDTHTRELRQTESPYRPDAAALAGRRLNEAQDSGSNSPPPFASDPPRSQRLTADPRDGPPGTRIPELLQTSGEVPPRGTASSSREALYRWVLSKVID